jgi:hypothetical protein
MQHGTRKRWSLLNAAGLGALLGMGLAFVHSLLHAFWSEDLTEDPLSHLLLDYFGFSAAGILLLVTVAEIRNRLMRDK